MRRSYTFNVDEAIAAARRAAAADGLPQFVTMPKPGDERYVRTIVVGAHGVIVDSGYHSNNVDRLSIVVPEVVRS